MVTPRLIIGSFFAGAGAAAVIIAAVFLTGQTFGQRCERLHPNADAATMESCIHQLSHQR